MSKYDKEEYDVLLEFILHVTRTVDKKCLLVMSENDVELLTNVLPGTPVELLLNNFGKFRNKRLLSAIQLYEIFYQERKNYQ